MNTRPAPHLTGNYELRIDGHLDEHWSTWFGDLTLTHEEDGTTTLRGPVPTKPSCTACSPRCATSAHLLSATAFGTTRLADDGAISMGSALTNFSTS